MKFLAILAFLLGLLAAQVTAAFGQEPSVPVKFYVLSSNGVSATNPARLPFEVDALNAWYQGKVKFRFAGTTVLTSSDHGSCGEEFNPEKYFDTADPLNALYELAGCLGDSSSINVFLSKSLGQGLNGMAMIDAPLNGQYAPSVIVSANIFSYGAITITHEIGHISDFSTRRRMLLSLRPSPKRRRYCGTEKHTADRNTRIPSFSCHRAGRTKRTHFTCSGRGEKIQWAIST